RLLAQAQRGSMDAAGDPRVREPGRGIGPKVWIRVQGRAIGRRGASGASRIAPVRTHSTAAETPAILARPACHGGMAACNGEVHGRVVTRIKPRGKARPFDTTDT